MGLLSVLPYFTLLALAESVYAESGCRCGDLAYLAIPRVNLSTAQQLEPCAPYKLIDARGSGESQGVSLMFQVAVERILANNSKATSQSVVYPAGFDQNVTSGVQNTIDLLKYGLRDCPDQKYFMFGYSQGAVVIQQALDKLDDETASAISSVVLVGNPYRIAGRQSNIGSQGYLDNRTANGVYATPVSQSNNRTPTYIDNFDRSGKVLDICLENDIVCAVDPECTCRFVSDHISYGLLQPVQDLISNHVISWFTRNATT